MAVTKIHPIKSTLKKALDYIENPDKTDEKLFVSSYGCSYETADIEFQMLLDQAFKKGNNLAHHLIQAFEPGETTPEQAHEIGKQLADEVLQGKYSYVLTTHIDKGHVHNHLIFCAVDMVNHRKYNSNRQSYAYIRRTSDRLCQENGLSVVKPGKAKGKTYAEWDAQKKGKSWKAKLKIAIDAAIPQAKDFDGFLRLMEAQGYEVKQGKYISFRALADGLRPGQERFTRCKTLGEDYTEERITQRIKGIAIDRGPRRRSAREISLRTALEDSIKAQQSAGYARWAKLHNLKQAANSLNFITEHQIDSYEGLESRMAEISAANDAAASALKDTECRLGDIALQRKNLSAYKQLRPVALELRNTKDKAAFRRQHESQLILYEAAAKSLKEAGVKKLPNLYALKAEYKKLDEERERLSEQYNEVKKELKEYGIIKQNVDSILRVTPGKEHIQEL
ncbi:MAG: relaxase/mobilization nuclease domain-containing protein [Hungatella sp.]